MRQPGPNSKQLRDTEDHAGKILATLAPHLILKVGDMLQGRGLRIIREFDQRREVSLTPWETRPFFTVETNPNVKPSFPNKRYSEIVKETGFTGPTVSKNLKMLMAQSLVIKRPGYLGYLVNPLFFSL